MANEPTRKDAGIVTAYGAAVRGGYTGTYEEFCRQQANYAEYAQEVEEAKEAAQEAAGTAQTAAETATAGAESAGASAENAIDAAAVAVDAAASAQQDKEAAAGSASAAAGSATAAGQAQTAAAGSATAAGQAQTAAEGAATAAGQSKTAAESAAGRAEAAMESYAEMTAEAETLEPGSQATAELDRTGNHPVLKLGLPEGGQGDPGVSPTVTVTDITGGHRVTITDAEGDHTFDVMNGIDGTGAVDSVNGKAGAVVLDGRDINVNNSAQTPETIEEALGDVNRALNVLNYDGFVYEVLPNTEVNRDTGETAEHSGYKTVYKIKLDEQQLIIRSGTRLPYGCLYETNGNWKSRASIEKDIDNVFTSTNGGYLSFCGGNSAIDAITVIKVKTDNTLAKTNVPADAKATGDRITSEVGIIDGVLNKYCFYPMLTSFPTGTRSGVTYTWSGNKCTVTGEASADSYNEIYNRSSGLPGGLTAGDKCQVIFDSDNENVRLSFAFYGASNTYISTVEFTESGELTIPSNALATTIRLLVANGVEFEEAAHVSVDLGYNLPNTVLKQKIDDMEEEVNDNKTETDSEIKNIKKVVTTTRNLFSVYDVVLGKGANMGANSKRALSAPFEITSAGLSWIANKLPSNLQYRGFVYDYDGQGNNDWIELSTVTDPNTYASIEEDSSYVGKYAYIMFSTINDQNITAQDFFGLEMEVENGLNASVYIPHETAVDNVAREKAKTQTKLTVCSYNVGHFANGVGTVPADDSLAVSQMKAFLNNYDPDILLLQENLTTFPALDETSRDILYAPLYPSAVATSNMAAQESKYKLINTGIGALPSGRNYTYGTAIIDGKEVFVGSFHCVVTEEDHGLPEYNYILNLLETKKSFIIGGDFNAGLFGYGEQNVYDLFINEGYNVSNYGYLGSIQPSGYRGLDNIITSQDIIIGKRMIPDIASQMQSDHLPVIAELFIT